MKDELIRIAREAGAFFRRDELTDVVSKEGHANYVTNIDCRVQAFLEEELLRLLPGSEFIGEEKENRALTDAPTWIVDPLDGTTNMIHDYRMSAVSIALCRNRKPVTGLVWQPLRGSRRGRLPQRPADPCIEDAVPGRPGFLRHRAVL